MALVEGILNKIFDRLWWRRASEQCGLSQGWSWRNLVKFDVPLLAIGKYLMLLENICYYWQMFGIIVKQLKIKHHWCGMCIITSIALQQKFCIAVQFSISASKWFCFHHIQSSFVIQYNSFFRFYCSLLNFQIAVWRSVTYCDWGDGKAAKLPKHEWK